MNWNELNKEEKKERCKKAISVLKVNINSSNCLDLAIDELNGFEDTDNLDYLEDCRKEIIKANKYRGYSNYCPLEEVEEMME